MEVMLLILLIPMPEPYNEELVTQALLTEIQFPIIGDSTTLLWVNERQELINGEP